MRAGPSERRSMGTVKKAAAEAGYKGKCPLADMK